MSLAKAVAFIFTRPDAVVLFGKSWKDAKDRNYRMHLYPNSKNELKFAKDRPNVVLVKRADKVRDLDKYAKKIHRVILFGTPEEIIPLNIPMIDVVLDENKDKYISAPRSTIGALNEQIEEAPGTIDLTPVIRNLDKILEEEKSASRTSSKPPKKKGSTSRTGTKKSKKRPSSLSKFLDLIETEMDDGDVWEDLEKPVLYLALGKYNRKKFESACKRLIKLGVEKGLCRSYFKWVSLGDIGIALIAAFESVSSSLIEGIPVNINSLADEYNVNRDDLSILYNLYKSELKEKETTEEKEEGE